MLQSIAQAQATKKLNTNVHQRFVYDRCYFDAQEFSSETTALRCLTHGYQKI